MMMMVVVEQSVECELAEENLHQCHVVHHKSHMTLPGLKPTNRLSYMAGPHIYLMPPSVMVGLYLHFPIRLHGVMPTELSTGAT
jgi:hypothetical protein